MESPSSKPLRSDFPGAAGDDGEYRRLGGPVKPADEGQRADYYLAKKFPFLSRAGWQKRIHDQRLLVNARTVRPASRVKEGDELWLHYPPTVEPEVATNIEVLWEAAGVMAVFKPGNLPMHENGPYRKNTFAELLGQKVGRQWAALHRLDRETSGIVLCAATTELRSRLSRDWAGRRVKKEYLAIVHGQPARDFWRVDGAIGDLKESEIRIKKWVVDGGLPALTDFHCLATTGDYSLLQALPLTGRTNQIRIHAAYSGLHLVGDKLYHPDESVFLEYFEAGNTTDHIIKETGFHRCCLHAAALEFLHPETGKLCRVESPLPEDLWGFWRSVGKNL